MSPRFRLMLMALGGASLCLLLLTCANLANLLLARAAARERELAVRAALGAGRERLMRQLVTESLILTLLGGAAGLLVAAAGVPLFASLVPDTLPIATEPGLDLRVIAFAALFTTLTALGFGLFPAIRAGRRTTFDALREGVRAGGGAKQRLRAVLVTVEVTMSVVLLITSGLLIRAVWRVQAIDPGFRPAERAGAQYGPAAAEVRQAVAARPVLRSRARASAGAARCAKRGVHQRAADGHNRSRHRGRNPWPGSATRAAETSSAIAGSPRSISGPWGFPCSAAVMSKTATRGDRAWVAVVSASFAERYWPGQDPIGRTFRHLDDTRTVVGVVGDIKVRGLERTSEPQMYLPAAQAPDRIPRRLRPQGAGDSAFGSGRARSCPPSARSSVRSMPSSRLPTCVRWTT